MEAKAPTLSHMRAHMEARKMIREIKLNAAKAKNDPHATTVSPDSMDEIEKKRIKNVLDGHDIPCREYFSPSLNMVFKPEDACPVSQSIASRILCLPLHFYMTLDEVRHISSVIKEGRG